MLTLLLFAAVGSCGGEEGRGVGVKDEKDGWVFVCVKEKGKKRKGKRGVQQLNCIKKGQRIRIKIHWLVTRGIGTPLYFCWFA